MGTWRTPMKFLKCKLNIFSSDFSSCTSRTPNDITTRSEIVGFIGLGNMGRPMAKCLIRAGYQVFVHDINKDSMKKFSDMGIQTRETPSMIAEASDVIITMLPSSSHVVNVYMGQNGLLQCCKCMRPWLFIDSSTIDPRTSRELSNALSNCILNNKRGCFEAPLMLDAPVSGGTVAAETGSLTFMVGGAKEAYMAATNLLLSMGKKTIYCGAEGSGSATKICNNLAMAISMLGVSEAFTLGQSLGVPAHILTSVFNSSSARCWSSDTYNPVPGVMEGVPASRNYEGGFATKLMLKDLSLALTSLRKVDHQCPLTLQANKIFEELCREGHEAEDFSCAFRHYYSGSDEF